MIPNQFGVTGVQGGPVAPAGMKQAAGIPGFDQLIGGGLPTGRVTLIAGDPGSGKTVATLQMLAHLATQESKSGLFVTFEEDRDSILSTADGFDWQFRALADAGKIMLFFPKLRTDAVHSGPFDLEGLLALLDAAIARSSATFVVFDGLDVLVSQLNDIGLERRELHRIRDWAIENKLTAVVTAKSVIQDGPIAQHQGFLQYLADCVILLQHNLTHGIAFRGIRVLKCRGTAHSANEYPLMIGSSGLEVAGAGSKELSYPVFTERLSSGMERLDAMLGGGYYRGSSILVSGLPGSAKTTLAGLFAADATRSGERAVFVSFDESSDQIVRNLKSVSIDLDAPRHSGLLVMRSFRAGTVSAEEYFRDICDILVRHEATVLVVDPISDLSKAGGIVHGVGVAERLLDFSKRRGITALLTSLITEAFAEAEATVAQISTLADTWMQLSFRVRGGERNRALSIMKSRGMHHSNQVRELILSDAGVTLADVYSAGGEVLMGTARAEREAADAVAELTRQQDFAQRIGALERDEEDLLSQAHDLEAKILERRTRIRAMRELEAARITQKDAGQDMIKRLRRADRVGLPTSGREHFEGISGDER